MDKKIKMTFVGDFNFSSSLIFNHFTEKYTSEKNKEKLIKFILE